MITEPTNEQEIFRMWGENEKDEGTLAATAYYAGDVAPESISMPKQLSALVIADQAASGAKLDGFDYKSDADRIIHGDMELCNESTGDGASIGVKMV
jgi:hypothetical protein